MMFVVSGDLPEMSDETVGVIEEIVRDQIHEIVRDREHHNNRALN